MMYAWNGKKYLKNYGDNLTKEQRALASIVNSLEDFKAEVVPTSTMAREIKRIQDIAFQALYEAKTHQDDIERIGCGSYRLKDGQL